MTESEVGGPVSLEGVDADVAGAFVDVGVEDFGAEGGRWGGAGIGGRNGEGEGEEAGCVGG